ncbi:MAG: N-acetylmuramoyl-L-alanine amidase [Candidatus Ratteibacteria bacterium]
MRRIYLISILSLFFNFLFIVRLFSLEEETVKETSILIENYFVTLTNPEDGIEVETIVISDEKNWCLETNNYAVSCWVHPSWVRIPSAKWIWRSCLVGSQTEECTIVKEFKIPGDITKAMLYVASDNECDVWINDTYVGNTSPWEYTQVTIIDVKDVLKTGDNVIKLWGRNRYWFPEAGPYVNPAGIIYKLVIRYVAKKYVIIDPGHGKYKYYGSIYYRGAVGPTYGDKEDNLNLEMAVKTDTFLLTESSYKTYMTRKTEWDILPDSSIGIENPPTPDEPRTHNKECVNARWKMANFEFHCLVEKLKSVFNDEEIAKKEARKRMIFVSIHCNSCERREVSGTEFLYYNYLLFRNRYK